MFIDLCPTCHRNRMRPDSSLHCDDCNKALEHTNFERWFAGQFHCYYSEQIESVYLCEGKYWEAPYILLCSYCELGSKYTLCDECFEIYKLGNNK